MVWHHRTLTLRPYPRGCHLITRWVVDAIPELASVRVGLLHVFIQHTSASLTINENADPDVRVDFETALNHIVPEDLPYVHTIEGPDDMPAHVKSSLMGAGLTIPIKDGELCMGTWQGIYLCEHRDRASSRHIVLTLMGDS
jgi:secondary thiamine-phosphate synthase enzyme